MESTWIAPTNTTHGRATSQISSVSIPNQSRLGWTSLDGKIEGSCSFLNTNKYFLSIGKMTLTKRFKSQSFLVKQTLAWQRDVKCFSPKPGNNLARIGFLSVEDYAWMLNRFELVGQHPTFISRFGAITNALALRPLTLLPIYSIYLFNWKIGLPNLVYHFLSFLRNCTRSTCQRHLGLFNKWFSAAQFWKGVRHKQNRVRNYRCSSDCPGGSVSPQSMAIAKLNIDLHINLHIIFYIDLWGFRGKTNLNSSPDAFQPHSSGHQDDCCWVEQIQWWAICLSNWNSLKVTVFKSRKILFLYCSFFQDFHLLLG